LELNKFDYLIYILFNPLIPLPLVGRGEISGRGEGLCVSRERDKHNPIFKTYLGRINIY